MVQSLGKGEAQQRGLLSWTAPKADSGVLWMSAALPLKGLPGSQLP